MPYIHTRTNTKISKEQEVKIKSRLGTAISLLNKSEEWLMVDFSDSCHMYFSGSEKENVAYIDIKIYGKGNRESYNNMTKEVTNIISEELDILPNCIYISYSEYENWGWNGSNF